MLRNILKYIDYKTRNQILVYQIPSIFQGFLEAIGVFSILPLMIVLIESDKETFFEKFNFLKPFLLDYTFKEIQIIIVACFIIFIIFLNIFISLNFILIPLYGLIGGALATLISIFIMMSFKLFYAKKYEH